MAFSAINRKWYQLKNGSDDDWEEWPEDDLPNKDTIFNIKFLNQFVAWHRYIFWIEEYDDDGSFNFLEEGDDIQCKDFWNIFLAWNPLVNSNEHSNGWINCKREDVNIGDTVALRNSLITNNSEWPSSLRDNFVKGERIQPCDDEEDYMRILFKNLRKRLDMLQVFKRAYGTSTSHIWSEKYGAISLTYEQAGQYVYTPPWQSAGTYTSNDAPGIDDSHQYHEFGRRVVNNVSYVWHNYIRDFNFYIPFPNDVGADAAVFCHTYLYSWTGPVIEESSAQGAGYIVWNGENITKASPGSVWGISSYEKTMNQVTSFGLIPPQPDTMQTILYYYEGIVLPMDKVPDGVRKLPNGDTPLLPDNF